jgi:hypothetical protein
VWLTVAKVHTEAPYSKSWFFVNTQSAWGQARDVKFRAVESNLYVLQFFYLGDWENVREGRPWNFRNCPVSIYGTIHGLSRPSSVKLDSRASLGANS